MKGGGQKITQHLCERVSAKCCVFVRLFSAVGFVYLLVSKTSACLIPICDKFTNFHSRTCNQDKRTFYSHLIKFHKLTLFELVSKTSARLTLICLNWQVAIRSFKGDLLWFFLLKKTWSRRSVIWGTCYKQAHTLRSVIQFWYLLSSWQSCVFLFKIFALESGINRSIEWVRTCACLGALARSTRVA